MPSWGAIIAAVIQGFLKSLFGAVRDKRRDREHDEALVGTALHEQAAAELARRAELHKEMADAQIAAPRDRRALAERLRRDAVVEEPAEAQPRPQG